MGFFVNYKRLKIDDFFYNLLSYKCMLDISNFISNFSRADSRILFYATYICKDFLYQTFKSIKKWRSKTSDQRALRLLDVYKSCAKIFLESIRQSARNLLALNKILVSFWLWYNFDIIELFWSIEKLWQKEDWLSATSEHRKCVSFQRRNRLINHNYSDVSSCARGNFIEHANETNLLSVQFIVY